MVYDRRESGQTTHALPVMPGSSEDSGKPTTPSDAAPLMDEENRDSTSSDGKSLQPAEELAVDSSSLLQQAREFLVSPAVRHQDINSKREFLLRKGVSPADAERLLEETDLCSACLPVMTFWACST